MKKNPKSRSFWSEFIPKSWLILSGNYSWNFCKHDFVAGVTVGIVALPLALAFAIAAGLGPQAGLYTSIIAGFLISLLGGSRFQIGGPTGAFVVVIYDIVQKKGYDGLVTVTLLAGVMLMIAALCRLGRLIRYVPYPLISGFTTGIAVIIFSSQVKDFFGLKLEHVPADFIPKWIALFSAFPTFDYLTSAVALGTLACILVIRHFIPVVPWGITSVVLATIVTSGFHLPIETIATRFGEIQREFPFPSLPHLSFSWSEWKSLIPSAITIAFLAGIESLLSAIVADGMTGTRHRSNCELMAQGIANIGSVVCGGIPATGALARTATNIKTGAKTPMAGMVHSATLFIIILACAPIVSQISLAALAAVLFMVAWNMSEMEHFVHLFRAPKADIVILLTTFVLTVLVNLTVGVAAGMTLAAFLFMKRMVEISGIVPLASLEQESAEESEDLIGKNNIPSGVEIYEITGPFFLE